MRTQKKKKKMKWDLNKIIFYSFSGVTPKNMEKKGRTKNDSYFFYGGETYTTQR